ncbi:MAG: pirin family protein [Alphaproteobacteria bacterium]|nr:pirin family protein [Alphaproteobacteria bacterium]
MAIRRAAERGHADHGWLDSHHTFSFASYHDPRFMGFSHLRVINEDRVAAGGGFPTHPHRNMEIVSYVIDGALAHRDTLGTGSVIRPGEVQLMSAGSGIQHSEMNASRTDGVHFLQIWVLPAQAATTPRYDQRDFGRTPGVQLVVSPDGRDGSLTIGQDTDIHRALLPGGETATVDLRHTRAWVQVVRGTLDVDGARLFPGDGLAVDGATALHLSAHDDVEALVFDLV